MSYEEFLEVKPQLQAALEEAFHKVLGNMSLEELKQLDWFTYNKPIPTVVEE